MLCKDEENRPRLAVVMYNLCESLRIVSILIAPFMPETTLKIQEQLGISGDCVSYEQAASWGKTPDGTLVQKGATLFPRIDVDKEIEALNALLLPPKTEEKPKIEGLAQIDIADFAKVELRVAEIRACEPVKRAKKLLKLSLFDGEGEPTK